MRIVQLSDIHLSQSNLDDLRNFYMGALINDLKHFNDNKKIDIILLTGDLLDKGGASLGENGYRIFEEEFINPIIKALDISKDKILFIPGNHDINREFIEEENEYFLANNLTKELANEKLKQHLDLFDKVNKRIERFKLFEKEFHASNKIYQYSNNESLTIEAENDYKVGFALINDSWRCSNNLKKEQHFIGFNQLFNANRYFKTNNTDINIAVFHHPLEVINEQESEEIDNILKSQDFNIAIFGHSHKHKFESLISSNGGGIILNGRSAFNTPNESDSKFQSGYNILDINIKNKTFSIYARKFIKSDGYRFDKDVDSLKGGTFNGILDKKSDYVKLNTNSNNTNDELPNGYSADVNRIVKLLIGKSLYPNPYIFVRELIQNAVDACSRAKEKNTHLVPQIVVNINVDENYFEVSDEGDGMSKKILKDHFSIIGKSISQEFNDANGNFNLISQFGIGFISTFIVAQKVFISTKSEMDDLIRFEITDVFKGFNYNVTDSYIQDEQKKSGTTVRVYLKRGYNAVDLFFVARSYCRHVENVQFYLNSTLQKYDESWNVENGVYNYHQKNSKYEVKLTIGLGPRQILASNSGFLISTNPQFIVPFKFPYFIGGEVNFAPKAIDFDISRTNIIETDKSRDFMREISVSLRVLFRQVLEANDENLTTVILSYLQYYLFFYDNNHAKMLDSYTDFYSKKELINLCEEYLSFEYKNWPRKLSFILNELKTNNINTIYISNNSPFDDYQNIVIKYLSDKGNLIIKPKQINPLFRDGQQVITTQQIIQIIAQQNGLRLVDINNVQPNAIKDIKMNKQAELPKQIVQQLSTIEEEYDITINIGRFSKTSKAVVKFQNEYFINYEHNSFQSLLPIIDELTHEIIKIYFLGLLGISLSI